MPAAAVIPAPLAYTKVVAVKTLVVGYLPRQGLVHWTTLRVRTGGAYFRNNGLNIYLFGPMDLIFYFEKIKVLKAG